MLDIKQLRKDPETYAARLRSKDPEADLSTVLSLDETLRALKTKVETLKASRNHYSKQIGEKKRQKLDTEELMREVAEISTQIHELDKECRSVEEKYQDAISRLPNLPMEGAKVSDDPGDNEIIKEHGKKPQFDFPFKNHLELNEIHHLFDFQRGAKISGTGWPIYQNLGAKIEWALINYMLDYHRNNGFIHWMPPALVRPEMLYGVGQLPKFDNQQFKIKDDDYDLCLIPTAEVTLNGLHYDEFIPEDKLPLRYVAYTPCFRREAGAAGAQERGLIRMHQFNKVEMFSFCKPEESEAIFEEFVRHAEGVLQGLELHYRNADLVTGDMSFPGTRTVDLEAWLPGQNRYYEVSSISNCTDFQARRSKIRYKDKEGKTSFVHTLNGSGLATSRLMVALLENNQQEDGSILLPQVLHPYLGGMTKLTPN